MSEQSVADRPLALMPRAAMPSDRERYLKRAGAWFGVLLIHVVIVAALLTAGQIGRVVKPVETREVLLILPSLRPAAAPPTTPRQVPIQKPQEVPSTAITLPKPPPIPKNVAPPTPQNDAMQGIGKDLACGAGSYENLSQAERTECRRHPWKFKKNNLGVIVLDAPTAPAEKPQISGIEHLDEERIHSDPCLGAEAAHTECIHRSILGK